MKRHISRLFTVMLAVLMFFAFSIIVNADSGLADDYTGKTVILSSNDVHGAIDGYAYMKALENELIERGADVLTVDAGDFSQGTRYVGESKGKSAISFMNAAGYDYVTIGNHEFDYKLDVLQSNLADADFKVLCADILDKETGECIYGASDLYTDEESGLKIGFFGLATPETMTKANPAGFKTLKFPEKADFYPLAQDVTDGLRADGADVVVCLSHLGVDSGSAPYRSTDLVANTTGIDMVIDGHSHTVMTAGENGEAIMSTGTKFQNIGVTVIDEETKSIESNHLYHLRDKESGPYTTDLEPDETLKTQAQNLITDIDTQYNVKVASSLVELNGERVTVDGVYGNRTGETNLGDLITDAMKWYIMKDGTDLGVPASNVVTIEGGGAIRAWIHAGDVTKNNFYETLPFGDTLSVVTVKGKQLLEALEASTYCVPDEVGGFPQVEGMNIKIKTYRAYAPNAETYPDSSFYGPSKIRRVTIDSVNGKPFDPDADYAIITTEFNAEGGDTYYVLTQAASRFDTGISVEYALQQYVIDKLDGVIDESYANPQGRITILSEKTPEDRAADAEEKTDAIARLAGDIVDAVSQSLSAGTYTTASYKVYMDALNKASSVLKSADSTTEDYLNADAELLTAMKALKKKSAQPMKASGKTVKLKAKLLKKKTLTVTAKKAFAVSKNKGTVTYKKSSGNKKITVSSKGKITVKKGLRKGTYEVKVRVTAAGDDNYRKGSKNVKVTIKVN